jgi:XTP/dITP diphosphohydrolase
MKILIATGNNGKKKEILDFFENLTGFEFLSLQDFPQSEEPEENGQTFEENALLKAKYFAKKFNIPTIGEDSGLILEVLPEKFGVHTRRTIQADTDTEWLEKFLQMLEKEKNRRAKFFSAMAFFDPNKDVKKVVIGECGGEILLKPMAEIEKGVPVSSIFLSDGAELVFSAMGKDEKNRISHRGKSTTQMAEFLQGFLNI